jgi:transcriptional regulator with XRE-family HTH domain
MKAIPDGRVAEVARAAGFGASQLSRYRAGKHADVQISSLERIARALHKPMGELLGDRHDRSSAFVRMHQGDWYETPVFVWTRIDQVEKPDRYMPVPRLWLESRAHRLPTRANDPRLVMTETADKSDASMLPVIAGHGTALFVDRGPEGRGIGLDEFVDGAVYVVRFDGQMRVRRVAKSDSGLLLSADANPAEYPPRFVAVAPSRYPTVLVGRVFYVGRLL